MDQPLSFEVPVTPVSTMSSSFRSQATTFRDADTLVVKPTGGTWVFCVFMMLVGVGVLVFVLLPSEVFEALGFTWFIPDDEPAIPGPIGWVFDHMGSLLGGFFGVLMVTASVVVGILAVRSTIVLDHGSGMLLLRRTDRRLGREARLSDVAAVQLLAGKAPGTFEANLVFSRPKGERLCVMCHGMEQAVRLDASKVAEFLDVPVLDHTVRTAAVDGLSTEVQTDLIRGWIDVGRGRDLRDAGPGLMVLKEPTGPAVVRMVTGAFGLFGVGAGLLLLVLVLVGLVAGVFFGGTVERGNVWLALLAAAVFAGIGSLLLFANLRWLRASSVTFDRVGNRISGRGLKVDGERVGEIALRDVRALQMLRGRIRGYESFGEAWQLNLILARPEGRRVVLITETDEKSLRHDAERLAAFLDVPVLDHTGGVADNSGE